jgi:hypothetical protein
MTHTQEFRNYSSHSQVGAGLIDKSTMNVVAHPHQTCPYKKLERRLRLEYLTPRCHIVLGLTELGAVEYTTLDFFTQKYFFAVS